MKGKALNNVMIWRKSLVGQLLLRFWVCHIIFFTLIGSIQYNSLKESLYQSVNQNLLSDYQSIRNSMITWLVNNELPPGRFAELRPGNFVAFYSSDLTLQFMIHSYGRADETMPAFMYGEPQFDFHEKSFSAQPFIIGSTKEDKYMLMVKPVISSLLSTDQLPVIGYAVIGEPLIEEDTILEHNIRNTIFNALIVLLLSTLLTAFALQKPLEPLLNISFTARKIAGGQYNLRLPAMKTASEIEQLREALNHMLGQMEHALNTERNARGRMARFIADASHELRTPLTSIQGFLEILTRSKNIDQETLDSAHNTMLIETERLIRLTEGLLTLNRISQEGFSAERQPLYSSTLQEVLPEVLPLFSTMLQERIFKVNHQVIEDFTDLSTPILNSGCDQLLPLESDELKQILYNLLNNAIQHTEPGGIIEILTAIEQSRFNLSVKDNGRGIPPEDLPHIFDRFFRGDRSRTHNKGQGSGLGLAIVSEIVRIRGGEIKVDSAVGEGTAFTVTFPLIFPSL